MAEDLTSGRTTWIPRAGGYVRRGIAEGIDTVCPRLIMRGLWVAMLLLQVNDLRGMSARPAVVIAGARAVYVPRPHLCWWLVRTRFERVSRGLGRFGMRASA